MNALTDLQRDLLTAASEGRLTATTSTYLIDQVEVDVVTKFEIADMVTDGLLYLPLSGGHGLVSPTSHGQAALQGQVAR